MIDKRIAVEVMGWKLVDDDVLKGWDCLGQIIWSTGDESENGSPTRRYFSPSNNISDAWLVVERMRELGYTIRLESMEIIKSYECRFYKNDVVLCSAQLEETAPMAISLAALKALEDK